MTTKAKPPPRTRSTRSTSSPPAAPQRDRTAHRPIVPFTVDHWRAWSRELVLDSGERWEPEPFQIAVMEDVFAGITETWMVVPEANGKTTLMGGVALYFGDYTPDAAVLMAASSRDQCGHLLGQASGFVRRTTGLEKRFRVLDGYRRIRCERLGGTIQVFAADERTGDGVIPTLALLDELHRHRDLGLYRTWRGKLGKRDGQIIAISTAGDPGSDFEETRRQLRQGAEDVNRDGAHVRARGAEIVLHDWSLQRAEAATSMVAVKAANPFSGVTVDSLEKKYSSPTMNPAHWLRFVCNVATRTEQTAVGEIEWEAAGTDEVIPDGEPVSVGIDLGWKWDTTAIVPLAVRSMEERLLGKPTILVPPRDGTSLPLEDVQEALTRLHERTPVEQVVLDRNAGGEHLAAWLEDTLGIEVVEHSQKPAPMALAAERFMEALRNGWLRHPRDPAFTRHVLNATARLLPDGTFRFDRPNPSRSAGAQERRVIDALIAAAMVHSVACAAPEAPKTFDGSLMEVV